MTGAGLSPDGKWVWNGTEWVPNTQTGDVEVSDSVISGNVIANQSVNSVDSEVVKAAMTGVVEALKELQPITQQTEPKSDTESTRLKELEMEKYLLEEKKRLKGLDRKRLLSTEVKKSKVKAISRLDWLYDRCLLLHYHKRYLSLVSIKNCNIR